MRTHKIEHAPMVRLGDLIELCDERNSEGKYGIDDVRGISIEKKLIFTKADMNGVSLNPYKVMQPNDFCYVTVTSRNGGKISLAMNDTDSTFILSSSYIIFRSKDENILLPEYLYLLLSRTEFDRYSRFNSWGSARETFDWSEMCRVQIPLPSIETQKELVAVYNGLKELAEENEKLLKPLEESCQAFIVDCKKKYPMKRLGDMIEIDEKINFDNRDLEFLGINKDKVFMPSVATTDGLDKSKYKVITKGKFVFSGMQTGRDICIRFGLYNESIDGLVSPAYTTYSVTDTNILPEFIMMNFKRSEMDRLGWFLSDSSVRSNLDFDRFHEIQIPVPPLEIQQKIVDLYNCYEECKRISTVAREKIKNLCPALVQKAAHSN